MDEYSSEHDRGDVERATELAEAHWEYVEDVLRVHGEDEETIKKVEFHYKTALIHGYLHRCKEEKSA